MPLLELHDITRQFKNGNVITEVLKGISLMVKEREFVSIMGPSGSGKSTMLNIVGCLDRPSSGTYRLAEKQVEKLSDGKLADIRNNFIGFVFQSFHLLHDLDAQANVELPLIYRGMGAKERHRLAEAALESVGLAHRRRHRPTQLSGGEQQRVAIARAIVGQPKMILADEPTGALDSRTGENIMGIFQKLNQEIGMTIVQVTHDRAISSYGHRIVHLKDGEIAEEEVLGLPEEESRSAADKNETGEEAENK
ncbi:ABC transporter ATP-binding protein [Candidatus Formimonas warabiya]|uniref:Macrolide ABC transporter ATP-binding protein n=1 Tax=Formimonas warabiya TaxID=1761012 RepID=A0A3G1L166_FORW1|nr:ABC transporter ATP-binding protein [Candidatus Formimonas warabiya]ATW28522.1 macrolide ABC transporter ATP-binding protein [Candidatus Formimonas warabiya]